MKRWSPELLAYEFVIVHRLAAIIQDIDGLSRYIDHLVHQYTIITSRPHKEDVTIRSFVYSFYVFIHYNNPCHVTASDALYISITTSSTPSIPTLYHSPIKFSTVCNFGSVPIISHQDTECHVLLISVAPPSAIT